MTRDAGASGRMAEQVDYYRARAPEYDQWWQRDGRYDKGAEHTAAWRSEVDEVVAWLDAFAPTGDVLEVAAGTGNFTIELARHADRITALDASPETLAINAAKLSAARDEAAASPGAQSDASALADVEFVVADIFEWAPPRRFDHVFFSFWLSHVPDAMVPAFFELVDRALVPGGRVAVVDNRNGPNAETNVVEAPGYRTDAADDTVRELSVRELNDGRTFTIVKVYRSPSRLAELLEPLGWTVAGHDTATYFTCATLTRSTG